jgi:iron complex outermembrane receptor protein
MSRSAFIRCPLSLSVAIAAAVTGSVPSAPVNAAEFALEEVVVTARKREESLQETPISVMAFGGDSLEQQNVSNITAMDVKMPNVAIGGSGGLGGSNAAFYVRGIGTSRNAVNQESAVALYVDDGYYGRSDGALLSVMDVEKIEVSRGPQGTLFGRSATAGAIRYITAKPSDELEGKVQATLGSENRRDLKGMVNIPLSDEVALRLVGATLNQDGHVESAYDSTDYGDVNSDLVRAYLRWDASENVEVLLSADYTTMDTNGGASILLGVNPNAPFVVGEAAAGFDATTLPTGDYDTSYQTAKNFNKTDNTGTNLTINWDLTEDIALKAATSYRDIDVEGAYDTDGTHASLFEQEYERDITMFSQEFNLSGVSLDGKLSWVTGLFYYDEKASDVRLVPTTVNSRDRSNTRIVDPIEVQSWAVFGQGTYDLNDAWSVTLGLRYTEDEKEISANELNADGAEKVETVNRSQTWDAITGRLSLEWQVQEDIFLFSSFARGFRSGGFNDRIRTNLPDNHFGITEFDEEILDMVEIGVRSELLDRRLRLNATAFFGEYTDMQLGSIIPGTNRTVVQNAGESEIKGIEAELMFALTETLTVDATFGYLDTEYVQLDDVVTAMTTDSDFPRAPELSFSIGLEADFDTLIARLDYGWKDDFRTVEADNDYVIQDAYGLLNLNLTYQPDNADWSLSVFGTNLTDEEYLVSGLNLDAGKPLGVIQGEPGRFREFGVKLDYQF